MQHLLKFQHLDSYKNSDFIVSISNLEAYKAIQNHYNWPHNRLLIIGEKGSGKTHLVKIWQLKANATFINGSSDLTNIGSYSSIAIENIEKYSENTLLETINLANEHCIPLLLTASVYPSFKINDLKSRIASTYKQIIKKPDEELIKILLIKQFSDRQIKIEKGVVDYLSSNIKKSFIVLSDVVNLIDKLSQLHHKKVTKHLVKNAMKLLDI